jgi:hypothetical protein
MSNASSSVFDDILRRSEIFHDVVEFRPRKPLDNKISSILAQYEAGSQLHAQVVKEISTFAEETRPIVHSSLLPLMCKFLEYKREYGSPIEQHVYKRMTSANLAERLLTHR